ncbi:MAG: hypothetical protein ABIB97_00540 [Patescibacteria group bacterium]
MFSSLIAAATETATNSNLASFDFSKPSWDLFIVLFFVIASLLYGISLGRDRIIVILVSIYMSLAIVNTAPFLPNIETRIMVNDVVVLKISTFLAVFIALFFLLSRSGLLKTIASGDQKGSWWQVIVFSILHVGLLISVTLTFLPQNVIDEKFSTITKTLFIGDWAQFVWIVAPVIAMSFLVRGASKKKFKYDI